MSREESGVQDPAKTLRIKSGSCRDFAVLMIEAVRSLGLAARFVTGYLYVSEDRRGERISGGATHAWLEAYLPGAGWVEFDPTNGIVGNHDLIRVAVARDPRQAVPISGTWTGFPADHLGMTVEVEVTAACGATRASKTAARTRPPRAAGDLICAESKSDSPENRGKRLPAPEKRLLELQRPVMDQWVEPDFR